MKIRLKTLVLLLTAAGAGFVLLQEGRTQRGRQPARTYLPPAEKMTPQGYPERYSIIISKNLFRKLGWAPKPKQESINLFGVVVSRSGNRALLSYNGKTLYVREGESVGSSYKAASIARGSVVLEKESGERRTLKLDEKVMSAGAPALSPSKSVSASKRSVSSNEKRTRDFRWRPPKGASGTEIFEMIMKREGYTWDDVKRNPELGGELKKEYSYVFEEMSGGDKK